MNLFYEDFPCSVNVLGSEVQIVTDFREYVKLLDMLKDQEMNDGDKMYFLLEYFLQPVPDISCAVDSLTEFISMNSLEKAGIHTESQDNEEEPRAEKQLFSFSVDYPYILSGFMRDYGIDLTTIKYLHWWEFRMLFDGLSDDTEIKQRIMYRSVDLSTIKDTDERKRIQKIQMSIQLPQEALTDYDIGNAFT